METNKDERKRRASARACYNAGPPRVFNGKPVVMKPAMARSFQRVKTNTLIEKTFGKR